MGNHILTKIFKMKTSTEKENVEYFDVKNIICYIIGCILIGMFIGCAFAYYKKVRYDYVNVHYEKLKKRHQYYETTSKQLEEDVSHKILDMVREMQGLQFYHKCHEMTDDKAKFPDDIKWKREPKYVIGQQRVSIAYNAEAHSGEINFPENPVVLEASADQWVTYSVNLPENGQANQVCILFFDNDLQ